MMTAHSNAPIGVFDSGIGGLSILKALRAEMPRESFVYFADSAHNPYGPKGDAFVIARSLAITQQLINDHHIKALVVACNTATAAAIAVLRAQHSRLPIIGVEPALRPAIAVSQTKRIAVLATRGTLQSAKFLALKASLADQAEFICTPCDGLADMIERIADTPSGTQDTTKIIAACAEFTWVSGPFGIEKGQTDTLVLGCTHYPLVLPAFRQAVGDAVHIVDNGHAIAQHVAQRITPAQANVAAQSKPGQLTLLSSQKLHDLDTAAARWL